MGMPRDLILVRHGQSEMNLAHQRERDDGDDSLYTPALLDKHTSQWRLTDLGRSQLDESGTWIREHIGTEFDRYYVSTHIRAIESAAHLALPDARWFPSFLLREREWGHLESATEAVKHGMYAHDMAMKKQNPLYWRPPRGESIADVCMRVDRVLQTLHRECDGKAVIVVCHGEVMWAFRMCIERMTDRQYNELDNSESPWDRIHNGQIVHFTRANPHEHSGTLEKHVGWRRSITPWDHERSSGVWEPVTRPRFSNEQLAELVSRETQVIR